MIKKTCLTCCNEFQINLARKDSAKFCSYKCAGKDKKKIVQKVYDIGWTIFRFRGREITKDPKKIINKIERYIKSLT